MEDKIQNNKNNYTFLSTDIKTVMENINKFIIPENQRAIEYLWNMNILTTMTNNYDNNTSWIIIGKLSKENEEIFFEIINKNIKNGIKITHNSKGFELPIKPGTKDIFEDFLPLFNFFKFQDVQKDGYMTIEEFFLNFTDCYKLVYKQSNSLENTKIYRYKDNITSSKVKIIDYSKIVKPLEDYLANANLLEYYDAEEEKIFFNKRLYDGHMRYKNYIKQKKL